MNRPLLLFLLLFAHLFANSQTGFLFIKKGGKKKRTYSEGDVVHFILQSGYHQKGMITLLRNDTIYLNGSPVPRKEIKAVVLDEIKKKPFPADASTFAYITGGVALTTVGLSLNHQNKPGKALFIASVIGYGPLLLKHLASRFMYTVRRKKFSMGKKYRLQVLDFYLPSRKGF